MKKLSKVLSILLMLALLCGVIAMTVSASETTLTVTNVNTTPAEIANAAKSGIEGNILGSASWIQYTQNEDVDGDGICNDFTNEDGSVGAKQLETSQLDAFTVNDGTDAFVMLVAGPEQNGQTTWNIQNTWQKNGDTFKANSYYVVDLDLASYTELVSAFSISCANRKIEGGGFPFGDNVHIADYLDIGSTWVHITVIGDIAANKLYLFADGKYVASPGRAYNGDQLATPVANGGMRSDGIKIDFPYTASASNAFRIWQDQSMAYDNVARRDLVDDAAIADLADVLGDDPTTADLTVWSGYPSEETRSGTQLPDIVEIDGVKYNDLSAAADALYGNFTKTVNILNNSPAPLRIMCDATVNTNGYECEIRYSENAVVNVSGEGASKVITINSPFIPSVTSVGINSNSQIKDTLTGPSVENGTLSIANTSKITSTPTDGNAVAYAVTDGTGNKFLELHPVGTLSNTYFELWYGQNLPAYDANNPFYVVYDFDLARINDLTSWSLSSVTRQAGSGKWGTGFQNPNNVYGGWEKYEFHHITVVYDFNNNASYFFDNNKLIAANTTDGPMSVAAWKDYKTGTATNHNALRVSQNGPMAVAMDNAVIRAFTGGELTDALAESSLENWIDAVYVSDYQLPTYPVALVADGKEYKSAADVSNALVGNEMHTVELHRDILAPDALTVNFNAVVETNYLNANIIKGEGVTEKTEGSVITYTAPYQPSLTVYEHYVKNETNGNISINASNLYQDVRANLENSIVTAYATVMKPDDFELYKVGATGTEDRFALMVPNKDEYTNDVQNTLMVEKTNLSAENYYVIDIDLATENSLGSWVYLAATLRFQDGTQGTPFSYSVPVGNFMAKDGSWEHITLVGDMGNNKLYVFVDGELKTTYNQAYNSTQEFNGKIGTADNLYWEAIKISNTSAIANRFHSVNDTFYYDNVAGRIFADNGEADDIASALEAGDLTTWSGYYEGKGGNLPAIATIDGVEYYSTKTATEALAEGEDATVEFNRPFKGTIVTNRGAVVNTRGYGEVVCDNSPTMVGDKLVSGKFFVSEADDVVTFTKITEANLTSLTVATRWVIDQVNRITETIYFLEGDKISYIGNTALKVNYIENGKIYNDYWADRNGTEITDFGVATKGQNYAFTLTHGEADTDVTIKNELKYNLSLYANFDVNLYVPADKATVAGSKVTIGDVEYVVVTKLVSATNVAEDVEYIVTYTVDDVEYTEKVTVNVVDYAVAVLDSNYSHQVKRVMITALDYANEVYKLLNGAASDVITAVLDNEAYAEYHVEANTEYGDTDNTALKGVISDSNLKLGSEVKLVLNVADGFNGTITINYNDYKGVAQPTQTFEVVGGQEIEMNIKIYNLACDFVITTDTSVEGTYSLGAYIKGLIEQGINADFAQVLFTYAKTAEEYKHQLNAAE